MSIELVHFVVAKVKKGHRVSKHDPVLDGIVGERESVEDALVDITPSQDPSTLSEAVDFEFISDSTVLIFQGAMSPMNDMMFESAIVDELNNTSVYDVFSPYYDTIVGYVDSYTREASSQKPVSSIFDLVELQEKPESNIEMTNVLTLWSYSTSRTYEGEFESEIDLVGQIAWNALYGIADKASSKELKAKLLLQEWTQQQGHDRCWYYPDIFRKLCELFSVEIKPQSLPSREEFEQGCARYQNEEYGDKTGR